MRASPPGVSRRGLLILSVILVGCTGSSGPAQTTPRVSGAPATVTPSSGSSPGPEPASPSCTSQQHLPPEGEFSDVQGWIAYRCGSLIVAVDPGHPNHPLSLGPSHGADPIEWSRDGTRLLLQRERPSEGQFARTYVANADGSEIRFARYTYGGSFSPDGTMVVYEDGVGTTYGAGGHVTHQGGLYVIDADGGRPRLLAANDRSGDLGSPSWSPDGSLIAFTTNEGVTALKFRLSVVNADGTGRRALVVSSHQVQTPAWAPDGSRLVFSKLVGLYVVGADGSGLHQITDLRSSSPAWSPDGSRIAFVYQGGLFTMAAADGSRIFGYQGDLFTMAADGSDVRRVEGVEPEGAIAWNPVG